MIHFFENSRISIMVNPKTLPFFFGFVVLLLTFPTVHLGFDSDDFVHLEKILYQFGNPGSLHHFLNTIKNLFVFVTPEEVNNAFSADSHIWWAEKDIKIAFFRPLSSFSHWVDGYMWPGWPFLMHLQNVILFALIVVFVGRLYFKLLNPLWLAGIAGCIFAIDDAHADAVKWIASRNSLWAFLFGILCILSHHNWRMEGYSRSRFFSYFWFGMSLLSAEGGVCTAAYLFAHALFIDREPGLSRFRCLWFYILLGFVYVRTISYFGYGAASNELYVDPNQEPLRFIKNVITFIPILLLGQLAWPDPRYFRYCSEDLMISFWMSALLICLFLIGVMIPLIKKDQISRFWLTGMILSLIPVCGMGIPSERLLLFSSLGSAGLLSMLLVYLFGQSIDYSKGKLHRGICFVLLSSFLFIHSFYAPIALFLESNSPSRRQVLAEIVNPDNSSAEIQSKDLVIVNAPSTFFLWYHNPISKVRNKPFPQRIRVLAPGYGDIKITRKDANTLIVLANHGFFPPFNKETTSNDGQNPAFHPVFVLQWLERTAGFNKDRLPLKSIIELPDVSIEITGVTDLGPPSKAQFVFKVPLESSTFHWLQWDWNIWKFKKFQLPSIGQEITIPGFWKV